MSTTATAATRPTLDVDTIAHAVRGPLLLATDGQVNEETVRMALPQSASSDFAATSTGSGPLADRVQAFERDVILAELKRQQYNVTSTAKALDLERSHLYKKAEQLGIDLRAVRKEQDSSQS